MSNSSGPTIVLIGGTATLDSGASVDSRQPIAGDEWDLVLRGALGASEAWWIVAKSFVDIVLAQHGREGAWALTWLDKTLKRPRGDGGFTRVRPKTFLDGAANLLEAGAGEAGGAQLNSDAASSRYRLLGYFLRFDDLRRGSPPDAIVGGFHTTYEDGTDIVGDRPIDYFVSRWPEAVIVLPHTPIVESKARRVLQRPPRSVPRVDGLAEQTHTAESRQYVESLERMADLRRADSYVLSHDFRVTFWADQGVLRDAADLDAAFRFVQSRYDLNLGLWDLARNPALRETLLAPEEVAPAAVTPAVVPRALAAQASEKAEARSIAEATEREGRLRHHEAVWPTLSALGWYIPHWQREGVDYRFPAGPLVPSLYPDAPDEPAVFFGLAIQKRQAVLALFEVARTGRTEEFLQAQSELIAKLTGFPPDVGKQVIWRIGGNGWGSEPEGWPNHLRTIKDLVETLAPLLGPLGNAAAAERIDQLKSTQVEITVTMSSDGGSIVRKKSLWDRIRGSDRK